MKPTIAQKHTKTLSPGIVDEVNPFLFLFKYQTILRPELRPGSPNPTGPKIEPPRLPLDRDGYVFFLGSSKCWQGGREVVELDVSQLPAMTLLICHVLVPV